jgi:LPS sulfotransferase NodH
MAAMSMAGSPPFFIVGPSRSGTTLLAEMLDNHSRIAVYGETQYYPLFWRDRHRYGDLAEERHLRVRQVASPTLAGVLTTFLRHNAQRQNKRLGGDKTPEHHAFLAQILSESPESPVVFLMRDPRDTVLSMHRAFGTAMDDACRMWNHAFASLLTVESRAHRVRYEDLVRDPTGTLTEICAFLGEDFEPGMLQFYDARAGQNLPAHHRRLLDPVDQRSVGRFRQLGAERLGRIEGACAEGMEALGYPFRSGRPEPVTLPPPSRLRFLYGRIRYYGLDRRRWRLGFMRWRILARLRWATPGRRSGSDDSE